MKKIVVVLVSLVVAVLIGMGNAFAQDKTSKASIPEPSLGPEWILVARQPDGTTDYFNTRKITYLPGAIVKVWVLSVPKGEFRGLLVNILKDTLFSEGKDPNDAERLWYYINLYKINCKAHQFDVVKEINYSFRKAVLDDASVQHKQWYYIPAGSVGERIENYVCNEAPPSILPPHKPTIPDPSLSSEWKLVAISSGGTTLYFNTRKITYLPKGVVKVWTLWVPRGEFRRTLVNGLKKILLSKGKDPNTAERFWYNTQLDKVDCKTHQIARLEYTAYSFRKAVLYDTSVQHEKFMYIPTGSVGEAIERYICKKHRR